MYGNNKIVAIIPARGGSKGVLRKNIKNLAGKPLIAYTIEEAKKSKYIDRVILSTDDLEISEVAKKYDAEVPFLRPKDIAKDDSSSLSVVLHAIDYLETTEGYFTDIVVFLQPTSPFRRAHHIDEGIEKLEDCDAVLGLSEVKHHPYFVMHRKGKYLKAFLDIDNRPLRRQDLPGVYHDNASLYVTWRKYYSQVKNSDPVAPVYEGKVEGVIMDGISSIDIDTPLDFVMAESVLAEGGNYER